MTEPVFLYNGPHPVHERMAERIGAEFVECAKGGVLDRFRAGRSHMFGQRPVLIEGGVPLLETAFLKLFGQSGPVIELAADATLIDIATPLAERPAHERLAHRFGERFVDATIAVSDYLAAHTRRYDRPVRVVHPFVERERFDRLRELEPGGDGETVLCVGKYRHKNGQDVLSEAVRGRDGVTAHFVGPDTERIEDGDGIERHGFVETDRLYELFERAGLMVFPARAGAYPVAVLEALLSGTPVLTSPYVGNADLVRSLHPRLVVEPTAHAVREGIEWALSDGRDKETLGRRARSIGSGFEPAPHLDAFEDRFNEVLSALRGR